MSAFKKVLSEHSILLILWLIVTLINLNKAYHIDDSFHLEAAQWIAKHPLHPMSGLINWGNNPDHIYNFNQPPLFFYFIALIGECLGYNEIVLHLFLSVFTFGALWLFSKISELIYGHSSKTLLILFAFCPAFIVNHNLMTDIPVLTIELAFMFFLLKPSQSKYKHLVAAVILSLGLLIKYSLLPLFIILLVSIIIEKRYKQFFVVLIPVFFLALWSLFNHLEYGGIHILARPQKDLTIRLIGRQTLVFIACLGSIAPFSLLFFHGLVKPRIAKNSLTALLASLFLFTVFVYFKVIPIDISSYILAGLFWLNGGALLLVLLYEILVNLKRLDDKEHVFRIPFLLTTWLIAVSSFIVLYAPFIATRHVLLIIPCILLIGYRLIKNSSKTFRRMIIAISCLLGLVIGITDWLYADFYRDTAKGIEEEMKGKNIYTAGHWGWQWYSKKNGMKLYNTDSLSIKDSDYLVYPADVSHQEFNSRLKMEVVKRIWKEPSCFTFFSVSTFASMYNSFMDKTPWCFSKNPTDTLIVTQVRWLPDTTGKGN